MAADLQDRAYRHPDTEAKEPSSQAGRVLDHFDGGAVTQRQAADQRIHGTQRGSSRPVFGCALRCGHLFRLLCLASVL
ncbi:Uncharacterised protein [Mycobacteroides abscessus subsp. abscessus]|nr:Uncharacterised protein [Mycobacteroides abscessus subsp. abscessus]